MTIRRTDGRYLRQSGRGWTFHLAEAKIFTSEEFAYMWMDSRRAVISWRFTDLAGAAVEILNGCVVTPRTSQ